MKTAFLIICVVFCLVVFLAIVYHRRKEAKKEAEILDAISDILERSQKHLNVAETAFILYDERHSSKIYFEAENDESLEYTSDIDDAMKFKTYQDASDCNNRHHYGCWKISKVSKI